MIHPVKDLPVHNICSVEKCVLFSHCFQGLVVPVIRNVETMSYKDIEVAMNLLGEKVRLFCHD